MEPVWDGVGSCHAVAVACGLWTGTCWQENRRTVGCQRCKGFFVITAFWEYSERIRVLMQLMLSQIFIQSTIIQFTSDDDIRQWYFIHFWFCVYPITDPPWWC